MRIPQAFWKMTFSPSRILKHMLNGWFNYLLCLNWLKKKVLADLLLKGWITSRSLLGPKLFDLGSMVQISLGPLGNSFYYRTQERTCWPNKRYWKQALDFHRSSLNFNNLSSFQNCSAPPGSPGGLSWLTFCFSVPLPSSLTWMLLLGLTVTFPSPLLLLVVRPKVPPVTPARLAQALCFCFPRAQSLLHR